MKATTGQTIEANVKRWFSENYPVKEYGRGRQRYASAYNELCNGCISGVAYHLIYYSDTCKFFNKYKQEIGELLSDFGSSPAELFGEKWDANDPLALDTENQNLLAWFGFETVGLRWLEERMER